MSNISENSPSPSRTHTRLLALLTVDTAVDGRIEIIADRVARSSARLCNEDGELFVAISALSTIFLLVLLYFSLLSLRPYPGTRYVSLLRVALSVQQPSALL